MGPRIFAKRSFSSSRAPALFLPRRWAPASARGGWNPGSPLPLRHQISHPRRNRCYSVFEGLELESRVAVTASDRRAVSCCGECFLVFADSDFLAVPQTRDTKEFVFKVKAYNHADRVKQQSFLNPSDRIQKIICNGEDLFDMLDEEYTFRDLFQKMGPISKSASAFLFDQECRQF